MANRPISQVLKAIEIRIKGHYIIIVAGINYYIYRRREKSLFYTTSGKYKDRGDNYYYTAKFAIRGPKK